MLGGRRIRTVSERCEGSLPDEEHLPTMKALTSRERAAMAAESGTELLLLGTPCIARVDARFDLPETAPTYLGLFLASQPGWVGRESVAAYLWPELPTDRAQHNLRVALNRLFPLLEEWGLQGTLQTERRRLLLSANSDLARFRAFLASGQWLLACQLPTGPFLQGVQFTPYPALAEWLTVERESIRRLWRKALFEAAAAGAELDASLARYLAAHPSDGDMAALRATRLVAAGRAPEAHDTIASFRQAAAGDLTAAELDASLRQIEHAVAGAVPGPAAREATVMLGRDAELAAVQTATADHRWVTVVGLPGSGKSTLIRAWLAQRDAAGLQVATVHIEINERTTASAAMDSIVSALAGPRAQRKTSRSEWLARLQGRLVLDGLDPATSAADWPELLQMIATEGVGLRVLAASRQPLGLPGEHVHRLGGLVTSPGAPGTLSAAAQLFLREAQRMRSPHGGVATDADLEAVARASGGLPLALKLAAAWSRWLAPRAIAQQITLAASAAAGAFDSSLQNWLSPNWERLSASERRALSSLSLSPGSFDMRAAVALAAEPVAIIESLIDRCLVDLEPGALPRLRLHVLVRAFAGAKLRAAPADRRSAIVRFIDGVAARMGPWPVEEGQPQLTVAQVAGSLDEVLAAWPLALEVGAVRDLPWLSAAILTWHEAKGEYRAGERLLAQALPALDESIPAEAAALAQVQSARATLAYRVSDYDAAERLSLATRALSGALGIGRLFRRATNTLGLSYWMTLRLDQAKTVFEEGLSLAEAAEDQRNEAMFGSNLALVEKSRGDFAAAESRWRCALDVRGAREDWDGVCSNLNNLANLLRHQRRFDECEVLAHEYLRLTREHGLDGERPFALIGLALLQQAWGKALQAEEYLTLLDACDADTVEGPVLAGAAQLRAQLALDRGDGDAALIHIGDALDICARNDDAANRAEALSLYGDWLSRHDDRPGDALRLWAVLHSTPHLHGTLRDEIELRFTTAGADAAQVTAELDLTLVAEQAMLAARKRLDRHRGARKK